VARPPAAAGRLKVSLTVAAQAVPSEIFRRSTELK
jgi:hypothetical protein